MKKNIISVAMLVLCVSFLLPSCVPVTIDYTRPPEVELLGAYGGSGNDEIKFAYQTADGGYITAGNTNSSDGDIQGWHAGEYEFFRDITPTDDICVFKFSSEGDILWQKCLGGSGNERLECLLQTKDGGCIMGGSTNSSDGDVIGWREGYHQTYDSEESTSDAWIVKLSDEGTIEWQYTIGVGPASEAAYDIMPRSEGGYTVAVYSRDHDNDDNMILQLSESGELIDEYNFCEPGEIKLTDDGGYLLYLLNLYNGQDCTVRKMTSGGDQEWQVNLGKLKISSFTPTNDGGCIIARNIYAYGRNDILITQISSNGEIQWEKTFGSKYSDYVNDLVESPDGGFIAVVDSEYSTEETGEGLLERMGLLKITAQGDVQWIIGDINCDKLQSADNAGYIGLNFRGNMFCSDTDTVLLKITPALCNAITLEPVATQSFEPTESTEPSAQDKVHIVSVSPDQATAGETRDFAVTVEYELNSADDGMLVVEFNTTDHMTLDNTRVSRGPGTYTFNVTLYVVDRDNEDFYAFVSLMTYSNNGKLNFQEAEYDKYIIDVNWTIPQ